MAGAEALRVGHPRDPNTEIGPLLAADRVERLIELIDEAVAGGATLHCGGPRSVGSLSGAFFAPAVLTDVPADARLLREDAPGPWLAIEDVGGEEEGIARCNAGIGGLGASVWTADPHKGARVAHEIRAGMVWMNDHVVSRAEPQLPWGAVHGVGHRPRARRRRVARLGRAEARHVGSGRRAACRGGSPTTTRSVAAWRALARLRSVRDADRERGWRVGALPLARVAARSVKAARRR